MTTIEIISSLIILTGTFFMVISAIGLIRFPDVYIRNSAISKAATLGIGLILLGIGIYYNKTEVLFEIMAIIFFIILIAPLSAYIIGRSSYKNNVPFWEKTNLKNLKNKKSEKDKYQDK